MPQNNTQPLREDSPLHLATTHVAIPQAQTGLVWHWRQQHGAVQWDWRAFKPTAQINQRDELGEK